MSGSLFREWKVALTFVVGIAVLAGALVSEDGELNGLAQRKPMPSETAAAVQAPVATKSATRGAGQPTSNASFGADDEHQELAFEADGVGVDAGALAGTIAGSMAGPLASPETDGMSPDNQMEAATAAAAAAVLQAGSQQ